MTKQTPTVLKNDMEVERYCPKCDNAVKLRVKTNRMNGNQFLGCPNWPNCDYTEQIPEALLMEARGQPRMF